MQLNLDRTRNLRQTRPPQKSIKNAGSKPSYMIDRILASISPLRCYANTIWCTIHKFVCLNLKFNITFMKGNTVAFLLSLTLALLPQVDAHAKGGGGGHGGGHGGHGGGHGHGGHGGGRAGSIRVGGTNSHGKGSHYIGGSGYVGGSGSENSGVEDKKVVIANLDKTIRENPKNANAYYSRGTVKLGLGDKKGAIADFDRAIRINPKDANSYYNRGVAKLGLGDKKGAVLSFNQVILIDSIDADAYYNRGIAKSKLGDKVGAIADLQTASDLYLAVGDSSSYQETVDTIQIVEQTLSN
jgi:TPR repeat